MHFADLMASAAKEINEASDKAADAVRAKAGDNVADMIKKQGHAAAQTVENTKEATLEGYVNQGKSHLDPKYQGYMDKASAQIFKGDDTPAAGAGAGAGATSAAGAAPAAAAAGDAAKPAATTGDAAKPAGGAGDAAKPAGGAGGPPPAGTAAAPAAGAADAPPSGAGSATAGAHPDPAAPATQTQAAEPAKGAEPAKPAGGAQPAGEPAK